MSTIDLSVPTLTLRGRRTGQPSFYLEDRFVGSTLQEVCEALERWDKESEKATSLHCYPAPVKTTNLYPVGTVVEAFDYEPLVYLNAKQMVEAGRKTVAIRLVQELTGMEFGEAMNAVEQTEAVPLVRMPLTVARTLCRLICGYHGEPVPFTVPILLCERPQA
jgi:hypothetical protein